MNHDKVGGKRQMMSKSSLKKPVALPNKHEKESESQISHWCENVRESSVCIGPEGTLNLPVGGGSEVGEFAYFEDLVQKKITYLSGHLESGDLILEIQGQKVAGFTQRDVVAWLNHCCKNGNPVRIRIARGGFLSKDLRLHLNTRFQKNSPDYELQNTVRDNLYLRTVPCTTRPPREGEINGVDYTFLTPEEFLKLERSGSLLESGIYEGNLYGTPLPDSVCFFNTNCSCLNAVPFHPCNHYGTPKPPREYPVFSSRPSNNNSSNNIIPGIHPSSEGKRRRNRSSVEAMTAKSGENVDSPNFNQSGTNNTESSKQCNNDTDDTDKNITYNVSNDALEPLPDNWEKAYTDKGEPYFIDHNTGTSHWLDPRLSKTKKRVSECDEDGTLSELPYGWEKIHDPHYGVYYINHIKKYTTYDNPVEQAKMSSTNCLIDEQSKNKTTTSTSWKDDNINSFNERAIVNENEANSSCKSQDQSFSARSNTLSQSSNGKSERAQSGVGLYNSGQGYSAHRPPYVFTRNPSELGGKMVRTSLVKSARGFGFTIVGGDDGDIKEFLQIKALVPNGPAWQDGKLRTGDVLVFINDTCVLGYSHQDVVSLFQSIPPGETVHLEVCQGYPLPFDPDDPNTEIVTTVAVSTNENELDASNPYRSCLGSIDSTESQARSAKSMPDLSVKLPILSQRHKSADLLSNNSGDQSSSVHDLSHQLSNKPEFLSVEIVKGKGGFGFTIADSVYGQKVKKILDRPRCQHLKEGDILVEINGQNIRGLAHTDVVQILKECPCGDSARITIQRRGLLRVTKMKSSDDIGVRRSASNNSSHSFAALPNRTMDNYGSPAPLMYRSKTPTADLYSSRDKEPVHVSRPKTPLVDTRYWPKPSGSDSVSNTVEQNDKHVYNQTSNVDNMSLSNRSDSYATSRKQDFSRQHHSSGQSTESAGASRPSGFHNHAPTLRTAYSSASDRTSVNPTWYTTLGKLRDTYWADNGAKDLNKSSSLSPGRALPDVPHANSQYGYSQLKLPHPVPPAQSTVDDAYEDSVFSHGNQSQTWTSSSKNSGNFCDSSGSHYDWNVSNLTQNLHRNLNTSRNGPHNQSSIHYGEITNNGPVLPNDSFHTNYPSSSHHSGHSPNMSHYDSLTRQKHSTSFENEHPSPVSTMSKGDKIYSSNSFSNRQGLRPPLLGGVPNFVEMTVTLLRQESGFGFRIVGGTEEGSQVSIGHIVPGGAADLDGRLHTGDEIVSVDNQIVLNTSHHRVVQLMGSAALNGRVTLGIRRRVSSIDSAYHTRSTESIYPYDVTVSRRENEGFGFVIISSVSRAGSTIGHIIEGSPADRCGQLHIGDRILAVNNISILNMHHGDIVNLIKDSGYSVTLTVGPPQDDSSSTTSVSQKGEEHQYESDDQYHAVELHRGTRGFGFSIRGGREFQNMPLFVLRIAESGPAHQDGKLLVGDQIIEINGINTKNMTHAEAIELIRQGGSSVRLLVKRTNQIPQAIIDEPSPVSSVPAYPPQHAPGLTANGHIAPRGSCDSVSQDYYTWGYDHR